MEGPLPSYDLAVVDVRVCKSGRIGGTVADSTLSEEERDDIDELLDETPESFAYDIDMALAPTAAPNGALG